MGVLDRELDFALSKSTSGVCGWQGQTQLLSHFSSVGVSAMEQAPVLNKFNDSKQANLQAAGKQSSTCFAGIVYIDSLFKLRA